MTSRNEKIIKMAGEVAWKWVVRAFLLGLAVGIFLMWVLEHS